MNTTASGCGALRRADTALCTEVGEGFVVMDIAHGKYFSLNATASEIWRAIERPASREEIVSALCARFDVGREFCGARIGMFLEKLLDCGIVEVAGV